MRRGMESISLWHCSGVMRAQVALIVAFSSSVLLGLAYRIFLFTIPHRFSMGLRSGEFAGQLRTGIPWSLNQVLVALALCAENITLDHSAAVQSFLSLAQARRFWRCLLFKSGLTQGMRQLKLMSCIRLCIVVLEALTPAAVHSLWISPTFLNGFWFTILSRVRLSLSLVHFFLPHIFLPFASLLMCLDTELCEQPASFAMTFCVLPSQLSSQQSSPWLCSLQN